MENVSAVVLHVCLLRALSSLLSSAFLAHPRTHIDFLLHILSFNNILRYRLLIQILQRSKFTAEVSSLPQNLLLFHVS